METILSFFSDLILFTAGLVVVTFWIALILIIVIETIDLINDFLKPEKEEEN